MSAGAGAPDARLVEQAIECLSSPHHDHSVYAQARVLFVPTLQTLKLRLGRARSRSPVSSLSLRDANE